MLHNQSILGFSLLVLSCASPSLGDALTPMSPPSSPTLGTNPGRAFQDINPPLVHPASNAPSSSTGVATVIAASSPSLVAGFNPAITPTPLAADVSPASGSLPSASSHRSGKHHAKLHSSIAAHFSSQFQLQAQTLARTPSVSHTSPVPEPTPPAQVQLVQSSTITTSSLASLASSSSADSAVSSSSPDLQVSTSVSSLGSSATLAISGHSFSASTPSMTGFRAVPTSHDLDDPNPDVHTQSSEASQRARRTTVLAALLILGTLGALGGGILCFRCGVFPCCHNKRRRRGPMSAERTVEEGLRGLAKLAPSAFNEKVGSLVPGKPPGANNSVVLPAFPRNLHAHTLSCSTCPPDSLNGVRGGVSGIGMGSAADIQVYGTNEESVFEDVTHILSSEAFADRPLSSEDSSTSTNLRSPRDSGTSRATRASSASGSDAARMSTATTESASVHTRMSRASGGAASLTAESYTTCESRYSTPSIDHDRRDSPPTIAEDSGEDEYYSPASPQSSASSASGGSVSVLLMTPEQNDYTGLADAALPVPIVRVASMSGSVGGVDCNRAASPADSDMDIDYDGSDWDVAQAYGAPPAIPLPPTPTVVPALAARSAKGMHAGKKPVKGRPQTGVGLAGKGRGGAVALGGRKVVLMHG